MLFEFISSTGSVNKYPSIRASMNFMMTITTLLSLAIVTTASVPRSKAPELFDPKKYCTDTGIGSAAEFCDVEFVEDGEITANTIAMVSTRDAQDMGRKACLKQFLFAKVEGGEKNKEEDDEILKNAAKEASRNVVKEFCEQVH